MFCLCGSSPGNVWPRDGMQSHVALRKNPRRWWRMRLYCPSLCSTNYSGDKCDINPLPRPPPPHPPTSQQRYWGEQSHPRLLSDVTLDWIESPSCSASATLRQNYLLLRNRSDLIHERQLCQGPSTPRSCFFNWNIFSYKFVIKTVVFVVSVGSDFSVFSTIKGSKCSISVNLPHRRIEKVWKHIRWMWGRRELPPTRWAESEWVGRCGRGGVTVFAETSSITRRDLHPSLWRRQQFPHHVHQHLEK